MQVYLYLCGEGVAETKELSVEEFTAQGIEKVLEPEDDDSTIDHISSWETCDGGVHTHKWIFWTGHNGRRMRYWIIAQLMEPAE